MTFQIDVILLLCLKLLTFDLEWSLISDKDAPQIKIDTGKIKTMEKFVDSLPDKKASL